MTEHRSELGLRKRVIIIGLSAIGLFILIAITGIVAALASINNSTSDTDARLIQLEERADSRRADIEALVKQVEGLGAKPVVDVAEIDKEERQEEATEPPPIVSIDSIKESDVRRIVLEELNNIDLTDSQVREIARVASSYIIPTPGPRGETGQPGDTPTQEQLRGLILQAVENVCADNACDGPQGEAGTDGEIGEQGIQGDPGRPPTEEEIAIAVAQFCSENNCDGPQGPGPTSEQIAQAVSEYCANDNCKGEPGTNGADGDKGEPGEDAIPFTFKFTIPANPPFTTEQTYVCEINSNGEINECTRE